MARLIKGLTKNPNLGLLTGLTQTPNLGLIAGLGPGFSNLENVIGRQLGPQNIVGNPALAAILGIRLAGLQGLPGLLAALGGVGFQAGRVIPIPRRKARF